MKQNNLNRVSCLLASSFAAAFAYTTALADPANLESLTSNPQGYLGKDVEITGYCVKGGVNGDVLGYECTAEGTVYVDTDDIEPASAKEKVDASCKGGRQDMTCRATIRFVPHSFTTSNVLEANKRITIFNTKKAELTF